MHICGKRYVDRVEDVTKITVYSNLPAVELFANGISLGKQKSEDHFFYFDVPNAGETRLTAIAGDCTDESRIVKVDTFNEAYRLRENHAVLNWFDITQPAGYFSLNDKISDIFKTPAGAAFLEQLFRTMMPKNKDGQVEAMGFELTGPMLDMMGGFTLLRLTGMLGMMHIDLTKAQLLEINAALNRIKKPE